MAVHCWIKAYAIGVQVASALSKPPPASGTQETGMLLFPGGADILEIYHCKMILSINVLKWNELCFGCRVWDRITPGARTQMYNCISLCDKIDTSLSLTTRQHGISNGARHREVLKVATFIRIL